MDELDFAIFRYLSPDGLIRLWGSRRAIDPRVTAREIAEKVGLSEAGVRARLKVLEETGMIRGGEVWLNPSLFDASLLTVELPVRDAGEAHKVLDELSFVDGVTFARDILDEEDRKIRVFLVSESTSATARRLALLRRLSTGGEIRGPAPFWIPPCTRSLTPLDWRLLKVFRQAPDATVTELAKTARVSRKTMAARQNILIESRACWWAVSSRSDEMPLSLLAISLREDADRAAIATEVLDANPVWIPVAPDGYGLPPTVANPPIIGLVPAERSVALERAVRRTLEIDGVRSVRRTFSLGSAAYPQWFDEALTAKSNPRG